MGRFGGRTKGGGQASQASPHTHLAEEMLFRQQSREWDITGTGDQGTGDQG